MHDICKYVHIIIYDVHSFGAYLLSDCAIIDLAKNILRITQKRCKALQGFKNKVSHVAHKISGIVITLDVQFILMKC